MTRHCVLSPADYRRMPWKNGAGRTTEIASHPARAALDTFCWRVSIADVVRDGPFSLFAGIDRTIIMIAGAGMSLDGDGHAASLRAPYEPYAFSGDDAIHCSLQNGPVRDFNLMLRRGRARGEVAIVRGSGARIAPAQFRLCYVAAGAYEGLLAGHPPFCVDGDHALLVEDDNATPAPFSVNPLAVDAVAIVVRIDLVP